MNFTIMKTSNEIEDTCIAYSLCRILQDNQIQYELINNPPNYTIKTEEINFEDLEFYPIGIEECYNINSSMSLSNTKGELEELNNFLENNIKDVFKYYNSLDNKDKNKEMSKQNKSIGIGNYYHTLGLRASTNKIVLAVENYKRHLSFLGWVSGVSYVNNGDIEISTILIPKHITYILKPFEFKYTDKETGEMKYLTQLKSEADITLSSRQYLETMIDYNFHKEDYEKIIFTQLTKAGNKPLSDKSFELNIYDLNNLLLDSFNKTLKYSTTSYEVKDVTAKYILQANKYNVFRKLIHIYSKSGQIINSKYKKEILNMFNDDKINIIYDNEVIQKLGSGLSWLLYKKKGFEIQIALLNISNKEKLQHAISKLLYEYERVNSYPLINKEELKGLIHLAETKNEAKIVADAILANAKVFINVDKNKEAI